MTDDLYVYNLCIYIYMYCTYAYIHVHINTSRYNKHVAPPKSWTV